VLVGLTLGTYALKSAAPLMLGGRALPRPLARLATLLPAALLAALVMIATFTVRRSIGVDARAAGLAAAAVALSLRAPFIVVVLVAVLATAVVRL
jgi:hypothetical protein